MIVSNWKNNFGDGQYGIASIGKKLVRERGAGSGERGAGISSSIFLKF